MSGEERASICYPKEASRNGIVDRYNETASLLESERSSLLKAFSEKGEEGLTRSKMISLGQNNFLYRNLTDCI